MSRLEFYHSRRGFGPRCKCHLHIFTIYLVLGAAHLGEGGKGQSQFGAGARKTVWRTHDKMSAVDGEDGSRDVPCCAAAQQEKRSGNLLLSTRPACI